MHLSPKRSMVHAVTFSARVLNHRNDDLLDQYQTTRQHTRFVAADIRRPFSSDHASLEAVTKILNEMPAFEHV